MADPVPTVEREPAGFVLYRYDRSAPDLPGKPAPVPVELMAGHPPIPDGAAIRVLASRVLGVHDPEDELPMWWHRSHDAWAATVDLHRVGMHDKAVALARLLHWCDQGGPCASEFVFEIRRKEIPADLFDTTAGAG
jgi:hypothetical protein